MIYNKIYDFCKVRNKGNCFNNGSEPTPRVKFIMELLDSEGIEYELDEFVEERFGRRPIRPFRSKSKSRSKNRFKFLSGLGISGFDE
jgi:hypothetical protein